MKISKSKQELARIISENGGWRDGCDFASQDKDSWVCSYEGRPTRCGDAWKDKGDCQYRFGFTQGNTLPNWHQSCLSRGEYFHLYPAPDADGWIEWKGGECPLARGSAVDIRHRNGREYIACSALGLWNQIWGRIGENPDDIIAYRLHKPERVEIADFNPAGDGVTDDTKALQDAVNSMTKPTIEQLAADYRNAKDYADRKQEEADDAKTDADDKLKKLELAGEALGLLVSPITAKQEPELAITNRSQLELGDVIWIGETGCKTDDDRMPSGEYVVVKVGMIGVLNGDETYYPDFSVREWRFIRRP